MFPNMGLNINVVENNADARRTSKDNFIVCNFFCKESLFEGPYEIGMYVVLTIFVSLGAFHKLCHQKLRFVDTLSVLIV